MTVAVALLLGSVKPVQFVALAVLFTGEKGEEDRIRAVAVTLVAIAAGVLPVINTWHPALNDNLPEVTDNVLMLRQYQFIVFERSLEARHVLAVVGDGWHHHLHLCAILLRRLFGQIVTVPPAIELDTVAAR